MAFMVVHLRGCSGVWYWAIIGDLYVESMYCGLEYPHIGIACSIQRALLERGLPSLLQINQVQ